MSKIAHQHLVRISAEENNRLEQIIEKNGYIDIIAAGFTHSLIWDAQRDGIVRPTEEEGSNV